MKMTSSASRGVVQLKMTLVGSASTGKTCLVARLRGLEGPLPLTRPTIFSETIAVHFDSGDDDLDDEEFPRVVVNLFDSSGQEKVSMSSVARMVYRSSHIVWLVFSVDSRESLEKIGAWHAHVQADVHQNCVFVLVGNKCDLTEDDDRQIKTSEAAAFASERGFPFFETSALDTTNVISTFQFSVREAIKAMKESGELARTKQQQQDLNSSIMRRGQQQARPSNPRGNEVSQKEEEKSGCCR